VWTNYHYILPRAVPIARFGPGKWTEKANRDAKTV
jgi:hypothetical protein